MNVLTDVYAAAANTGDAAACVRIMYAHSRIGKKDRMLKSRPVRNTVPLWMSRTYRKERGGMLLGPGPTQWHYRHPRALNICKRMVVHPTVCTKIMLRKTFGFCEGRWKFDRYKSHVVLYKRTAVLRKQPMAPAYRPAPQCADCLWANHGDPAAYRLEERTRVAEAFGIEASEVCDVQGLTMHPDVAAHFASQLKYVYFRAVWHVMNLPDCTVRFAPWEFLSDRLLTTESIFCDCMLLHRSRFPRLLPCIQSAVASCHFMSMDKVRRQRIPARGSTEDS
jgi:hypothetical protein